MYNVSTFEASESIKNAADAKGDESMLHCLLSVNNDLIAAKAKYHKNCFSSYVSKSNLKHQGFGDNVSAHDAAFKDLVRSITPGISDGRAYNMLTLLHNYQENLKEIGVNGESQAKHQLKECLKKHFFQSQQDKARDSILKCTIYSRHHKRSSSSQDG